MPSVRVKFDTEIQGKVLKKETVSTGSRLQYQLSVYVEKQDTIIRCRVPKEAFDVIETGDDFGGEAQGYSGDVVFYLMEPVVNGEKLQKRIA
ncbi:hypothetical protein Psfp_03426 [Pelotomaculum sp. FP]|nr:hypothetical protein Psfp_03426 [Pelotomaculum sp. FP]